MNGRCQRPNLKPSFTDHNFGPAFLENESTINLKLKNEDNCDLMIEMDKFEHQNFKVTLTIKFNITTLHRLNLNQLH